MAVFEELRSFINFLEAHGELLRIKKEVDPRHISPLIAKSDKALLLERIKGYDTAVAGGIISSRRRLALGMGCSEQELGLKFLRGLEKPIEPILIKDGPVKEVVLRGDEVDLTKFPIPLLNLKDGGPYISSGVVVARDEELGRNVGMYRLMYRKKDETSIDLVSPTDLRLYYQRAYEKGRPLPIAVATGATIYEMLAASHKAAPGLDEFSIAGGLMGEPINLVKCETVDLEVPANAEIVLEGELLPIGWTVDEGRFGDFTGFQGSLRWNPVFKIKAITHRRNPLLYALHMPWENDWLSGPPLEASGWRVLMEAGVMTKAVSATPASCCSWHLIASIKKRPGEGKNALLALLSLQSVKLVIVTDDDVDIFNPIEVERALAFRVQADKDVIIVSEARGKHLDPTLRASKLPKGSLPTTAKMGIDATIPDDLDISEYERLTYPFLGDITLEDYL